VYDGGEWNSDGSEQGQCNHPEEVGVALHPLTRVVHRSMTAHDIAGVAISDIGVVLDEPQRIGTSDKGGYGDQKQYPRHNP